MFVITFMFISFIWMIIIINIIIIFVIIDYLFSLNKISLHINKCILYKIKNITHEDKSLCSW